MKKFFFCFAATVAVQMTAFSQITFTASDLSNLFAPGKSWLQYSKPQSASAVTMDVGVSSNSAHQTWTMPSVLFADSMQLDNVQPSSTPYFALFPFSAYAQKAHAASGGFSIDFYQYFSFSNDSLFNVGVAQHYVGSNAGHIIDTTIIIPSAKFDAHLPVQLGLTIQNPPDTTDLGNGFTEIVSSVETYDAYGTLHLPIGSFEALRSKTIETTNVYNGSALTNSHAKYSFHWLTKEGHQMSVDADTGSSSGTITVTSGDVTYLIATPATSVAVLTKTPARFALDQNYPNPFNPATTVRFTLRDAGYTSLKVFDLLGREVATLVDKELSVGSYTIPFDAGSLSSGVYLYQLRSGTNVETKRMILMK